MTADEELGRLLREALPPVPDRPPSPDLWPRIAQRDRSPRRWPWLDLGIAAAVVVALSAAPRWIWILLFHL